MGKSISVHEVLKNTYDTLHDLPGAHGNELPEEFINAIGLPAIGFHMIVWGESGNGKTTFVVKLCKALSAMGRVYYNSKEQGEGRSIQNVFRQCAVHECKPGSFVLGDRDSYEEMLEKLSKKRQKTRFVVIDSIQYMKLTLEQQSYLQAEFPHISFIFISWEAKNGDPDGRQAAAIRYAVDIKTRVRKGVAISDSRYGTTVPFRIMPWVDKEVPKEPKALKQKADNGQLALEVDG